MKICKAMNKNIVYYFCDSPLDINVGEDVGIKTTAVATGSYSSKYLSKSNPDFNEVLSAMEGD